MKKFLLLAIFSSLVISAAACTPPTTHAIIKVGAVYIHDLPTYNTKPSLNNLGIHASIGVETPNKYSTISAETMCVNLTNETNWCVGLNYGLNPLGVRYDSPINFKIVCGVGYMSNNGIYGNVGLQLELGRTTDWLVPYAVFNVGLTDRIDGTINCNYGVAAAVGLRLRIGSKTGW